MMNRQFDIVKLGASARKKTIAKRMRKWFLGDDKAFAAGLDEMGDDQSEPPLSRPGSRAGSPRRELEVETHPGSLTSLDPPLRFSSTDTQASSSRGTYSSGTRQPLAYQQRKLDRAAHLTRSTRSSPPSATSAMGRPHANHSPPVFSSTDSHPRFSGGNTSTVHGVPDDTQTMDSEMGRDLKDMYINRYQ